MDFVRLKILNVLPRKVAFYQELQYQKWVMDMTVIMKKSGHCGTISLLHGTVARIVNREFK